MMKCTKICCGKTLNCIHSLGDDCFTSLNSVVVKSSIVCKSSGTTTLYVSTECLQTYMDHPIQQFKVENGQL